jgi:UDP-3-O-[3-hydroxymyristoyl] glucosamine N-acyltransferase
VAYRLQQLAELTGCRLQGDPDRVIRAIATLDEADPDQISFLANSAYRSLLSDTRAGAVIVGEADVAEAPCSCLVSSNPYLVYAQVAGLLAGPAEMAAGIHPGAWVDATAEVDASAYVAAGAVIEAGAVVAARAVIGPNCLVGRDSRIGEETRLEATVTVLHEVTIGARCRIHPGAVIGADGFGFARDGSAWVKIPQLGGVRIGDDVEIGANTTIDRGALKDTVIEDGVILDNLIQVAHNVEIGAQSAIAGCVGISGSTRIGRRCTLAGGVGLVGHIELADDVHITGMSMVTRSIKEPGTYSGGFRALPHEHWQKNVARFSRLDAMARRMRELETEVTALRSRIEYPDHMNQENEEDDEHQ